MAVHKSGRLRAASVALICLLMVGGCQMSSAVSPHRLIASQSLIDFSGLERPNAVQAVQTTIAVPRHWEALRTTKTALYTHQQWRSPSTHTGVGVLWARLPLPLGAKTVVWLAKHEYAKHQSDGKVLGEWTDDLGRCWFEAENDRYHVTGYVIVEGFSAWIVYFGYRVKSPPNLAEISLAARSAKTAVPSLPEPPPKPTLAASR